MNILGYEIRDFFTDIYIPAEIAIIDLFHDQGIDPLDINPRTSYYKKVFFNYILKTYINTIKSQDKRVFYIIGTPKYSELQDYFERDDFIKSYFVNIKKAVRLIPMNVMIIDGLYEDFFDHPETYELLMSNIPRIKDQNIKKSYSKLSSFIKTYDLVYLDNKIFKEIQNKFMFC